MMPILIFFSYLLSIPSYLLEGFRDLDELYVLVRRSG